MEATLLERPASKNFAFRPFRSVNHNVVVNIATRMAFGLSDGIWLGTVLANYLFHLGGNEFAGYAEAAMGVASLVVALPAGYAADRGSKASVVAVGGLVLPVAVGLTCTAIMYSSTHPASKELSFIFFVIALSVWGGVQSIANGPAQALYADSIATGERSRYFQYSFGCYMSAQVIGPVISIILFVVHHNSYDPDTLRIVFLVGQGLSLLASIGMLSFRERCSLTTSSKPARSVRSSTTQPPSTTPSSVDSSPARSSPGSDATSAAEVAPAVEAAPPPSATEPAAGGAAGGAHSAHRLAWAVPYLLFSSSLLMGVASGMTIKFFPLYFRCSCRLSPAAVQGIYAIVPLLLAAFSRVGTAAARRLGRVQVLILFKVAGISLLVLMATLEPWLVEGVAPHHNTSGDADCHSSATVSGGALFGLGGWRGHGGGGTDEAGGDWGSAEVPLSHPPLWKVGTIVLIYLVRTALMNCTYPLNASIMMDFTPTHQRARWQSLGSIVKFGWCGAPGLSSERRLDSDQRR